MEMKNYMLKRLIGLVVALLVIGGVSLIWYKESIPDTAVIVPERNIVSEVDRGISPEDQPVFDSRIDELKKEVSEKSAEDRDLNLILRLGNAYYSAGKLADAVSQYDDILRTNPQDGPALENKAQALYEMGDYEGAEVAWYAALALDPREDTYIKVVNLINEQFPEKSKEALRLLEEAVQNNTQTVGLMIALGNWYRSDEDFQQAIVYYELAQQLSSDDSSIKKELLQIRQEFSEQQARLNK